MTNSVTPDRLREAMERAGHDQSSLARKLNVTPAAINQIVTGKTQRSRYMPAIADELGVSVGWLMGTADEPVEGAAMLSVDENRLLAMFDSLRRPDRNLILALMERLSTEVAEATLHSPKLEFKGQGAR